MADIEAPPKKILKRLTQEVATEPEEDINLAPQATEILSQLLQKMGETCTIQGVQDLSQINLVIEGEDAGLLIGKQGQTLEALQYLVTKILSKHTKKSLEWS